MAEMERSEKLQQISGRTESIIYGSRLVLQNIQWGMEDYM